MTDKKYFKHQTPRKTFPNELENWFAKVVKNGDSYGINLTHYIKDVQQVRIHVVKNTKTELHLVIEKI